MIRHHHFNLSNCKMCFFFSRCHNDIYLVYSFLFKISDEEIFFVGFARRRYFNTSYSIAITWFSATLIFITWSNLFELKVVCQWVDLWWFSLNGFIRSFHFRNVAYPETVMAPEFLLVFVQFLYKLLYRTHWLMRTWRTSFTLVVSLRIYIRSDLINVYIKFFRFIHSIL